MSRGRQGKLRVHERGGRPRDEPSDHNLDVDLETFTKRAGIKTKIGNHTFRATGITAYLKNSGKLEIAQQIAAHESSRTTGLYDRRDDDVSLDEVVRISM
jgi:integrase